MTPTLPVDPARPDPAAISRAAELLRAGQLVAFPTETVYGLGAHALDAAAVRRIFEAKGRPAFNPVIVHVATTESARELVSAWPPAAQALAERFWPGPLTLVLPRARGIPDEVTAAQPTVAVRIPAHPVALALLREARVPIAAPSANRYTELSPTTAAHVERALGERVALILDGGPTMVGIESTVVDLSGEKPVLLRPGLVSAADIEAVVGPLGTSVAVSRPDAPRPSPGMIDKHYAPRARLLLVQRALTADVARALHAASGERARGGRVGVLALASTGGEPWSEVADEPRLLPAEPAGYARGLYAALHELDDAGCTLVLVERVPEGVAWEGIRDRLSRAAH